MKMRSSAFISLQLSRRKKLICTKFLFVFLRINQVCVKLRGAVSAGREHVKNNMKIIMIVFWKFENLLKPWFIIGRRTGD